MIFYNFLLYLIIGILDSQWYSCYMSIAKPDHKNNLFLFISKQLTYLITKQDFILVYCISCNIYDTLGTF